MTVVGRIADFLTRLKPKQADVSDDDVHDDHEPSRCERCDGEGWIACRCGGDLCVCENYGEAICPKCGGG